MTTLAADGPGSLAEALRTAGPRIVVFEVAGVIDLKLQELRITEPFLTVAGQTAPSPGITLIRGGLTIATHDVVVRHLRIRPGTGGLRQGAGVDFDAITTVSGARRFVAQSWPFDRVRAVAKAFDGTLNDAVLAMCAGALRRHHARRLAAKGGAPPPDGRRGLRRLPRRARRLPRRAPEARRREDHSHPASGRRGGRCGR